MTGDRRQPSAVSLDETIASLAGGTGGRASDVLAFERGDVVGRYVVLEDIGRGAMGLVVSAYDPELDRKVALKLVRVGPGASESAAGGRARLIREAQAMARLAHPNVITIHDVGSAGDDVFIAMEFVDGGSLRQWLTRERPSWQQIVAAFIQAGEGLAAAHAQGIVHRDFKPDNVLVRADGRVGVADFGLARRDDNQPEPQRRSSADSLTATLRDSSVDSLGGLTMTGATLGTPAYMAPEQHLRSNLDHRCDQFAFCVALWEALVGRRPHAGATLGAIALNVTAGKRDEFPRDSPVPTRLRAALERGLRTDPDQRFPSMQPLLDELRATLRADRRRGSGPVWARPVVWGSALALAIASGIATAVIMLALTDEPEPEDKLCAGASERMLGVWDEQIAAEARAAFERSGRRFARRSFTRAAATLDGLREQWLAAHTAACEATRVYGELSEDMLDRKMACLARRRGQIAAVGAALRTADAATVEGVEALLATIEPIADCDDLEQLATELAPAPADRREQVEALRDRIAEFEVRRRTATNTDAVPEAAKLRADAEALGYPPLVAEALNLQASVSEAAEGPSAALPIVRRALTVATESGHRRASVNSLTLLGWIEGVDRGNHELGLWLLDLAAAEVRALGDPVRLSLPIRTNRGAVLFAHNDYEAALHEFEAALEVARNALGDDHIRVADLRFNIAGVQQEIGDYEAAERGFRRGIVQYTELLGAEHPEVAQCHSNLAISLASRGKFEEAEQQAFRAIAIWEADGGNSYLPSAHATLGDIALRRGDLELARSRYERAHAMKLEIYGEASPSTLSELGSLAEVEHMLGRHAEARAYYRRGIEVGAPANPDHSQLLELRLGLAQLELETGELDAALAQLDELDAAAARLELPALLGVSKLVRAELEVRRGHPRDARALLAEAEPLLREAGDADQLARARALLAELE